MRTEPESIEEYYARIASAADAEGRLSVAVEEMPGWDIYPYELESLRLKPIRPLADYEPPRSGEDPAECWCAQPPSIDVERRVWSNERWKLDLGVDTGLPIMLLLGTQQHYDLPTLPPELAAEMGTLITGIASSMESLPSVGRAQLAKYGDGGAHLHLFFFGRPTRILQFRGSPLLEWEENLPRVPMDVLHANARYVATRLVAELGGTAGTLVPRPGGANTG
ncbi:hypothetical protein [Luteipulveratus mongoliensis]|uniref:HIT domain-containing protein n=1 Tax=Luteipulveratus mongoliensis TaxID=571913 RepID=A0A0K1JRC6_9MICO|nr:hypothetical protein [Luteipulveratus mongoliensis]AKU19115.1 hypothetical protein VV02_19455 [Luteipulveratus mongoliensis]